MGIKSNATTIDQDTKPFPKLMAFGDGDILLAINSNNKGVAGIIVVSAKGNATYSGKYAEDWLRDSLKDFNGTVTLANE